MLDIMINYYHGLVDDESTTLEGFAQVIITTSQQSLEAMSFTDGMGQQCEAIFSLLGQVESLANQTNLLALNDAIESARAGSRGEALLLWQMK